MFASDDNFPQQRTSVFSNVLCRFAPYFRCETLSTILSRFRYFFVARHKPPLLTIKSSLPIFSVITGKLIKIPQSAQRLDRPILFTAFALHSPTVRGQIVSVKLCRKTCVKFRIDIAHYLTSFFFSTHRMNFSFGIISRFPTRGGAGKSFSFIGSYAEDMAFPRHPDDRFRVEKQRQLLIGLVVRFFHTASPYFFAKEKASIGTKQSRALPDSDAHPDFKPCALLRQFAKLIAGWTHNTPDYELLLSPT